MESRSQQDNITTWFVRRKVANTGAGGASDAKQAAEQRDKGKQKGGSKGSDAQQKPAAADAKPKPAPIAFLERHVKEAAAGALAEEKKQQKAEGSSKRDGGSSGSGSDSDTERPPAPAAAASTDQARTEQQEAQEEVAQQQHAQQQSKRRPADGYDSEAEDRPRVVAYSDSDSDVESHFKRVKSHLLPPSEEEAVAEAAAAEAAAAAEQAAAEAAAAAAAAARRGRIRRASGAVATAAGAAARSLAPHLTPGLAARSGGLLLLERVHPAAAGALEFVGIAAPLIGAAAAKAGVQLAGLPGPLLAASHELGQLGKAAAAVAAGRVLYAGMQHRRTARQLRRSQRAAADAASGTADVDGSQQNAEMQAGTPGRLLRRKSSVNLANLVGCEELDIAIQTQRPQTAAEWAAVYAAEMAEMRRMLEENEVELPPERFDATNAELLRFAKAAGLLTAKGAEQRAAAVEAGISRVVHTVEWVGQHRFMSERELKRWGRLVAWKSHDAGGRPILLARVGRAMQLVRPERYEDFTRAVLSLMQRGLTTHLSNTTGAGEQMVVVLDCRGSSSMGMTRHMGLLKKLAVTLTQHFPDRLHRLHLLELPLLLRWALHAVMPLLHPATRSKMVMSSINDPDLAVTVAFLTKRRSSVASGSKDPLRRTLSNCSFASSGEGTPAQLLSPQPTARPAALAAALATAVTASDGEQQGAAAVVVAAEAGQPSMPALAVAQGAAAAAAEATAGWVVATAATAAGAAAQAAGSEEAPNTPPPTLKAPQSPREASSRGRRRLQHPHPIQELTHGQDQQQRGTDTHHPPSVQLQSADRKPAPPSPFEGSACRQQQRQGFMPQQQPPPQQQQAACAGFGFGKGRPAPLVIPSAAAAASPGATPFPSAAASAAVGLTSHAVPWSPGMQSPAGNLSRHSSFGEELLHAASTHMQAGGAGKQQQVQKGRRQQQQPVQDSAADFDSEKSTPSIPSTSTSASSLALPSPTLLPVDDTSSDTSAAGGSSLGTLAGLASLLSALLPARLAGQLSPLRREPQAPPAEQPRLLPRRLTSLTGSGSSSRDSSPGSSPYSPLLGVLGSARRRGGLMDLPERSSSGRATPNRGMTPRKSSLRRSESADALLVKHKQQQQQPRKLGSHPLRRQSSVSWAEELESVKEILPHDTSPAASPLRQRLATQSQLHALLAGCLLVLMTAVMLQRLLLVLPS